MVEAASRRGTVASPASPGGAKLARTLATLDIGNTSILGDGDIGLVLSFDCKVSIWITALSLLVLVKVL